MKDKIKIVHILNTLCVGGIENIVIELCNRLNSDIYEVTLVVLSNNKLDLKASVAKHVKLILIPINHKFSSFRDIIILLMNISQIITIFKEIKPDIIHTHTYQYNLIPILLAIRIGAKGAYHFHTIHTSGIHYENTNNKHKLKLKIEDWWYNRCETQIVCISSLITEKVVKLFSEKKNPVITIWNGIDLNKFNNAFYIPHFDETIRIVYTSRLDYGKSHDTLLSAFALLLHKYQNIELILIGDGVLCNSLKLMAKDLNIERKVKFLGNCRNVPEILAKCDIGAFPSEFEGFGIALIEMMAMGLPIVCTNIQIFHSIFLNESNAFFFSSRNYNMLAQQIGKLIINKDLRYEYGQKSLKISKQFSIDDMILKYEKIYNKTVKFHGQGL